MVRVAGIWSLLLGGALAVAASWPAAAGTVLITSDEAKLPPAKAAVPMGARGGITRGPRIELAAADQGPLHSPVRLQITFQAFGGAKIDVDSLRVTYLKLPAVDLTPRVKPFAMATGIVIPDAELPPGDHNLRIELRDSDGRSTTTSFVLSVQP